MLISGCAKETPQPMPEIPVSSDVNEPVEEPAAKVIQTSTLPEEISLWNRVESYVGDVDADGADEEVILVTSAERNADGDFIWNDGHNWALYVTDREQNYLLFKEHINAGYPYFEISDYYMEDGAKPQITAIVSSGAGFTVKGYSFSEADGGYVEKVIYDTKDVTGGNGINRRYSSLPEYHNEHAE